jgi:hypothetical protein
MIYKTLHRKLKIAQHEPTKIGDDRKCSRMVSNSCSTCGIRRVTLVTNPVISHESGKDRILITTNGTYP